MDAIVEDINRVIGLISSIGGVPPMDPDTDFYDAGFASLHALQLLIELETQYDITLEDDRFIVARTPRGLAALVLEGKAHG